MFICSKIIDSTSPGKLHKPIFILTHFTVEKINITRHISTAKSDQSMILIFMLSYKNLGITMFHEWNICRSHENGANENSAQRFADILGSKMSLEA